MSTWIGTKQIAVIPAIVTQQIVTDPEIPDPPTDFHERVLAQATADFDPASNVDRSLRKYLHTISYGKAVLDVHVTDSVTVAWAKHGDPRVHDPGQTMDSAIAAAIAADPAIASIPYKLVVFHEGFGLASWAFYNDGSSGTAYVFLAGGVGTWGMEVLHMITAFGDLYNTAPNPGNFDNMAATGGTHPSTYTKLAMGWLDPGHLAYMAKDAAWDHIGMANGVVAMAAINNRLFAATSDNKLWWRDAVGQPVNWGHIGQANDFVAMAATNGKLFAATTGNKLLWRVPVGQNVSWTEIGHANDLVAMTAIDNKLFAATKDNKLWWRDPVGQDVDWLHIGHAEDVVAMAAINGKLFAATKDNRLWWRDPVGQNLDWFPIGHATNIAAMAAINGKLFAATKDNKLWWRDGGAFTLHALGLLQPPPSDRVTAIRIPSAIPSRYFLVEARLSADPYESATAGLSVGIPSQGVVVYEIDAAWPVQLRTPVALSPGQKYTNATEQLEIEVVAAVPGGFTTTVRRI